MGAELTGRCTNRIALLTGSSSGIGRALALRFAGQRARVVVNGQRAERCKAVVDEAVARPKASTYLSTMPAAIGW